ncbi:TetR/AcrR family transcriptional regulator [Microbacterium hydrocarbonoxydans]|uniref:DNA-binding transcriptional regulator, AcrR family n=1 Tax=Microbacterium hydrocarbonoxydans TaxID=273678 RepID=A0A1H4Q8S0_9MICO|nr:TetR/AcrR family transcriptional regulator [Microbacterium hydrocarbonoxydans]SEC15997.1 DNA-binding transcriptional regulator, AcrR family [Microbacterium hydrocarbonoxydans]
MSSNGERSGLRERSKARRRRHILHTALRLFAEQGYEKTSIADIADAAEVAPRTVTGYFPSKLDFITEWPARAEQRLIALGHEYPGIEFLDLVDRWWRAARDDVDAQEAALTRAMALSNPGIVAMAETEVSRRFPAKEFGLPSLGVDASPLEDAGRRAIQGVSDAYFRALADDSIDDDLHGALLDLVRTIMDATGAGHGALERHR